MKSLLKLIKAIVIFVLFFNSFCFEAVGGVFSGTVTIDSVSTPWYFAPLWFDSAACSRVYYQINNGKPIFLVESAGPHPPVAAPIEIPNLHQGDKVTFLVKTCQGDRWVGPVYSFDKRFFISRQEGENRYYFQFEDAVGFDMAYNDGAFYFYKEGEGTPPNKFIQIKEYKALKTPEGILFTGKVKVNGTGKVNAQIEIRDNHWSVYKTIDLSFDTKKPNTYGFKYKLKDPLPAPMYTSFLKVSFRGEKDARVRALKGCVDTITSQENAFGTTEFSPFSFEGELYFIPPGTSRLPDFSKLKPAGKIYTPVLNVPPRDFSQGFPGVSERFEWFAIRYTGQIFVPRDGEYIFYLLSDDGSKLIIDGKTVINNDGIHPPAEKSGSIFLKRGLHKIEVQYFQGPRYQVALVLSIFKNGQKIPLNLQDFAPIKMEENACETTLFLTSGILFDFNSANLKPEAQKVLDNVYEILKQQPFQKIIVEGYTDNVGAKAYNKLLSTFRAKVVAIYLMSKGIPPDKIEAIGYGEENPRYPNDTEEHRALNRRVEIKIIKPCN